MGAWQSAMPAIPNRYSLASRHGPGRRTEEENAEGRPVREMANAFPEKQFPFFLIWINDYQSVLINYSRQPFPS
ncbi:hypothetical protein [Acidithiobacillus sulfuriphilus]|uniref:Uncharacterized protein n=2 Tax=Acidithiobacillus sulfuriphilus TaxID=1867749 RepID=A0A3M8QZ79_9PROT|nr:hypothetical protein [Acidithiobacillus sulfuriphilus]RNF61628.1 hypothetical protein EC580_08040 [Acidithiobacillus sulfuriphilus]